MKQKNSKTDKIKIKLIKSPFGYKKDQISTVRSLGLRKMNQINEVENSPISRGMIFKVKHLIKIID
jgi:large subunit ribosomal protein L30